jgi:uncharacterized protein YecE (DUF72 family)
VIRVGTSGFRFDDWKGAFYPAGVPTKDWLSYYARQFDCLEVNGSYYRLFPPTTFAQMMRKVPADFSFTVKAYRTLTHDVGPETEADREVFLASLAPLQESGQLGCLLAQFPTSFRDTPPHRAYLAEFRRAFGDLPLVVEFRQRDWAREEVFAFLRSLDLGFCCVDEPALPSLMPRVAVATTDVGYVRFHGRNARTWWQGGSKERYDYLYSEAELNEWMPKIEGLAGQTKRLYLFMNNCFQGQAATNATQLKQLLQQRVGTPA